MLEIGKHGQCIKIDFLMMGFSHVQMGFHGDDLGFLYVGMGFHYGHMGYDSNMMQVMNDDKADDKAASRIVERILWE